MSNIKESDVIYDVPVSEIHVDYNWNSRIVENIDVTELKRAIKNDGKQKQAGGVVMATPEEEAKLGKKYILVYGFRRFLAISELNFPYYRAVIEEAATDEERRKLNFSENHGRSELTFHETAIFIQSRMKEGWTEEKIMKELGLSRSYVQPRAMYLKLIKKHPQLEELAKKSNVTQDNIRRLNSIVDFNAREEQIKELKEAAELGITFNLCGWRWYNGHTVLRFLISVGTRS